MSRECPCDEWRDNIGKVTAPQMLTFARNPVPANEYQGVPFKFCPWCGAWLDPEYRRNDGT